MQAKTILTIHWEKSTFKRKSRIYVFQKDAVCCHRRDLQLARKLALEGLVEAGQSVDPSALHWSPNARAFVLDGQRLFGGDKGYCDLFVTAHVAGPGRKEFEERPTLPCPPPDSSPTFPPPADYARLIAEVTL